MKQTTDKNKKVRKNRKKYDKPGKYILDEFSLDVIKFFAGLNPETIKVVDKELDLPAKFVDSAFIIDDKYILNIEIQTKYELGLYDRLLYYNVVLSNKHNDIPVDTLVIFLKKESTKNIKDNYTKIGNKSRINFKFDVIKLWELNIEEIIKSGLIGLIPFVPVIKKDENLLKICHDKIMESDLKKKIKSDLINSMAGLSGLLYEKEVIKNVLSYEKLKDSVVVQEWFNEGEKTGEIKGEKKIVLKLLTKKFKKLPEDIIEAIKSIEDTKFIEKIAEKIFDFKTLDDLTKLLPKK